MLHHTGVINLNGTGGGPYRFVLLSGSSMEWYFLGFLHDRRCWSCEVTSHRFCKKQYPVGTVQF